jgi:hypothetical protein
MVLGLPWRDDEQAPLKFGASSVFTLMGGTLVDIVHKLKLKLKISTAIPANWTG